MELGARGVRAATLVVCLAIAGVAVLAGCGASRGMYASKAMAAPAMAPAAEAAPPPPLERSLFARNPDGTLSEDHLQEILDSPIELDLPARVGVLPIVTAKDWRGPNPAYDVPAGVQAFVKTLRGAEHFTLVTEIMPIPSGALGMEALREMAARYRLRYIILYREQYARRERANGWAAGYATIVGAFFLPGATLYVDGYIEASLFDVKTGLLMFTVRRSVSARETSNLWHRQDKLRRMEVTLATRFAPDLAKDTWNAVTELAAAQEIEDERRARKFEARQQDPAAANAPVQTPVQPND
jgi:hypothetical protein